MKRIGNKIVWTPIVTTAKVRGIIKKNGIGYVDAVGSLYPSTHTGINVWQLCDNVYFKVYGFCQSERISKNLEQFAKALETEGLTYQQESTGSYKIVKKVA